MLRFRWNRFRRALAYFTLWVTGVFLGALILPLILAGEIYEYQDSVDGAHLPETDAIVCLAGGRGRITAAGDLWYRYWEHGHGVQPPASPPVLYLSGVGPSSNWNVLEHHLRKGVLQVIRNENVVLETESQNTEANARLLAAYAKKSGWSRIILVTSPYHMRRAQLIFDRVLREQGLSVQVQTLSVFQDPFEPGEWRESLHGVHVTVQEYLKWVYYRYFWAR